MVQFRRLVLGLALLGAGTFPVVAHTSDMAFVLLLPTGYYLAGGTFAVAITFGLVYFVPRAWLEQVVTRRWSIGSFHLPKRVWTSAAAFLLLAALVALGFLGSRDPRANPLPVYVWSLWWVGFTFLQALLGDLWRWGNPFLAPHRALLLIAGRRGKPPLLAYPDGLGYWPATLFFFGFAWFELVDLAPDDPARLARAVIGYFLVTQIGMMLFGARAWLGRAEAFSVFLGFIAQLSPLRVRRETGRRYSLTLGLPGARLLDMAPLPTSGIFFLLLTLASVSFDGLSRSFWWLDLGGINPLEFPGRSAVLWQNTIGLVAMWLALAGAYFLAMAMARAVNSALGTRRTAGLLVASIIPIALAYHFAHYLTVLLVDLQYGLRVTSDPLATGADLLGLGRFYVTTSFLNDYHSVVMIWNAQAGAIILGHLIAVAAAHLLSGRLAGVAPRAAYLGQIPLAVLMVLYTLFGLWLMATPTAG